MFTGTWSPKAVILQVRRKVVNFLVHGLGLGLLLLWWRRLVFSLNEALVHRFLRNGWSNACRTSGRAVARLVRHLHMKSFAMSETDGRAGKSSS